MSEIHVCVLNYDSLPFLSNYLVLVTKYSFQLALMISATAEERELANLKVNFSN